MNRFLPSLFIMLFLLSCGKEVNIKTTSEPRQALFAFFTDLTDTLNLYLANSAPLMGEESKGITTAEVSLFENGVKVFDFASKGDGFYQIAKDSFTFKEGSEYEITSKVTGLPDISAKAIFVPEVKLDSLAYEKLTDRSLIDIWFQDPDEPNYYGFFMAQYFTDTIIGHTRFPEVSIQGIYYYDEIVSDSLFNGESVKSRILAEDRMYGAVDIGAPGTKVKAIMLNTEQIWYKYEQAIEFNVAEPDEIFFIISTANLPTNVEGGYGIFGLGNASTIEKIF